MGGGGLGLWIAASGDECVLVGRKLFFRAATEGIAGAALGGNGGGAPPGGIALGSPDAGAIVHVFSICTKSSPFGPLIGVMTKSQVSVIGAPFLKHQDHPQHLRLSRESAALCTHTWIVSVVVKVVGASNKICCRVMRTSLRPRVG